MKVAALSSDKKQTALVLCSFLSAMLFLFLGIFTTADRLIELGPLRQSLTSDIESVRDITYTTVFLFRICCCILAVLIMTVGIMWKKILRLPLIQRINAHEVRYSSIRSDNLAPFNISFVVICACLIFVIIYIRWGPAWIDRDFLIDIGREDHLIEQLQTLLFFLCSISFLVLSIRLSGPKAYRFMYGLFAFVFFVMVGEEISWGQRIFSIATPEALQEINVQDEINLHNSFGYFADHLFVVAVLVYGFLFPIAAHTSLFIRKLLDWVGLPLPTLGLAIGFLFVSLTHSWTVGRLAIGPYEFLKIAEIRELLTAVAFFLLAYEAYRLQKAEIMQLKAQ